MSGNVPSVGAVTLGHTRLALALNKNPLTLLVSRLRVMLKDAFDTKPLKLFWRACPMAASVAATASSTGCHKL